MAAIVQMHNVQNQTVLPLSTGLRICTQQGPTIRVLGYAVTWHQLMIMLEPLIQWDGPRHGASALCRALANAPLRLILQPLQHR